MTKSWDKVPPRISLVPQGLPRAARAFDETAGQVVPSGLGIPQCSRDPRLRHGLPSVVHCVDSKAIQNSLLLPFPSRTREPKAWKAHPPAITLDSLRRPSAPAFAGMTSAVQALDRALEAIDPSPLFTCFSVPLSRPSRRPPVLTKPLHPASHTPPSPLPARSIVCRTR